MTDASLELAARTIAEADALVVAAGAGMGVDSGLPDFRGDTGFWKAYPPLQKLGIRFVEMANPSWFDRDPTLAWGFYGHRLELYRQTEPHAGFGLLLEWCRQRPAGYFVFTSNVDGHFQRAGFEDSRVVECHGSLNHLQCSNPCGDAIWSANATSISVAEATMRAGEPLPRCPTCDSTARPNVLMFGDGRWVGERTDDQQRRLEDWISGLGSRKAVIVECGAGMAVPTVRHASEQIARITGGRLIRINPREAEVPRGQLSVPLGALFALEEMAKRM
ncbi:NAD-dependent protein deacetylase [Planctomycetes bacterium Pan216]|uniref:protein acetyllysine N-acetyltransferase n=1 Tax=Kolteria novifilia TaxID=2527975 RepID=A0A518BCU7_9BACT|nr:NAD-dependent protein deacetylase [Planctomycetes bacterium Pan216]